MQAGSPIKPQRTVQFETGMAMTLSCAPRREPEAQVATPQPAAAGAPQQRGPAT